MANGDYETHPSGTHRILDEKDLKIQKLRDTLEKFANDTDDCVSPGMKELARKILEEN